MKTTSFSNWFLMRPPSKEAETRQLWSASSGTMYVATKKRNGFFLQMQDTETGSWTDGGRYTSAAGLLHKVNQREARANS